MAWQLSEMWRNEIMAGLYRLSAKYVAKYHVKARQRKITAAAAASKTITRGIALRAALRAARIRKQQLMAAAKRHLWRQRKAKLWHMKKAQTMNEKQ
jgi:hypothetical protein